MGTFNSNILPTTTGLTLGSSVQQWNASLNNVSIGGQISINGVTTQGNGIPAIVAAVDLTNQTSGIAGAVLYSVINAQQFRVSWNAKVTTAASVSSTLGSMVIAGTDPDGNSIVYFAPAFTGAGVLGMTHSANSTSQSFLSGVSLLFNCKAGTNIVYNFGYASSPVSAMAYNLHIRLEAM